jgi:Fe-S cluster biogenesis protein NfuA
MALNDVEVRTRVGQLESLLERLEALTDPAAREVAVAAVQVLLEVYGEGLARVIDHANRLGGAALLRALAADELVAHLLLLHGLHPVDVETRVEQALAEVRPYLASHGGNVELVGVRAGIARLRLQGSCSSCPASAETLRLVVEAAVQRAAPDLEGIAVEGVAGPAPRPIARPVKLQMPDEPPSPTTPPAQ